MGRRIRRKRQNSFNRTAKEEENISNNTEKKNIQSEGYTVQFCSLPDAQPALDQLPQLHHIV